MRNLKVYIECNGNMINVGSITGHNSDDAVFSYSEEYVEDKSSRAISISLPLDERSIRLAPAYDLLSTVIYDSSTEKMSLNIDGEYDIRNINQKSFENEAKKLGLGKGIATQHFLSMVEKFEMALEQSTYELGEQGYGVAVDIQKQILKKAGIHNLK